MGTTYPSRLIFFSPRNPQGNLRTTEPRSASIDNIQSPQSEVDSYIGSSRSLDVDFRALEYHPGYHEYSNAPTTRYEFGGLYNEFGENEVISDNGDVIDGREISLVSPAGSLDQTASGTKSVSVSPAAAPPRTVTITNDAPGPVELTLPTTLSEETWDRLLEDEMAPQGYIQSYDVDENAEVIEIQLQGGELYKLEMPRLEIADSSPTANPTYVAPSGSGIVRTNPGHSVELEAEVRDEYNNPIPDEEVTFDVQNGPSKTVTADSNGVASFTYTPSSVGNKIVNVDSSTVSGPLGSTSIEVQVGGTTAGPVIMTDSAIDRSNDQIELTLQNEGEEVSVQRVQLQYASEGATSQILTSAVIKPRSIQEGPTSIDEISFLGDSDSTITVDEGRAPVDVSLQSGGNAATLGSGSSDTMVFTLDGISDNSENSVLFSVRVFYSGGYYEIYSIHFTS
jgi:hypothetical protein